MLLITDDDKSSELTEVVTRLVNTECGNCKFVGVQNPRRDGFVLLLLDSKVILHEFTDKLNTQYQIRLGTPENTPHGCANHLLYLLKQYNVPGDISAAVKGLLKNKHISEAVYATKEILMSRMLFVEWVCLLLYPCLVFFSLQVE